MIHVPNTSALKIGLNERILEFKLTYHWHFNLSKSEQKVFYLQHFIYKIFEKVNLELLTRYIRRFF